MPLPILAEAAAMAAIEVGKLLIQAYAANTRLQGKTPEQGRADFLLTYDKFMVVSAAPVEEVKL